MQEERTEDILSTCEVSLKNIEEKPFWYLCKYSITNLQSLVQGIMGNAINGTACSQNDGVEPPISSLVVQSWWGHHYITNIYS